jgi:aminopeptidase YwaD
MLKLVLALIFFYGFQLYSQTNEYARSIVNTLASKEYMGRGYCGRADLKSADFIRNEFRKLGIQALGNNYFQLFNLNVNTFPGKMEVKFSNKTLLPGINYLVDPSSSSLKGKFKVIRISKADLNNPEKVKQIFDSSSGKALLIDITDTIKFSKSEEEKINKIINAIKYDPVLKNSLTIILSDKRLIWSISGWQAKKTVIMMNPSGLDTSVISEIEVNIKASFITNYQTQNVIGMIRGSSNPDSFLVVTAHYDHLGIMGKETYFPGANDNASGVAMLLSLCKYFALNPPKYSMVFITFSAEEAGLLGAENFLQNPLFKTEKTRFLINFDLAGTGDEGIKVINASVYKREFEKLQQINEQNKYLSSVLPRGEACISDHCIFYMKKIPCFYIYTLGGISAYHDIFDKAETLPLTEFYDYSQLIIAFLVSL